MVSVLLRLEHLKKAERTPQILLGVPVVRSQDSGRPSLLPCSLLGKGQHASFLENQATGFQTV